MAYPKGDGNKNYMSLYLNVADPESLTCGRRRVVSFYLKVVNQLSDKFSQQKGVFFMDSWDLCLLRVRDSIYVRLTRVLWLWKLQVKSTILIRRLPPRVL